MKKILIIDDAASMRLALESHLQRAGFLTECVWNAGSALDVLKSDPPDLILLDLMIPGMNGLQLLKCLHRTPGWKHIPVVILSGRDDAEARRQARRLGVRQYLVKSQFTIPELLNRVRGQLNCAA